MPDRQPYAMKTLISQVKEHREDAEVELSDKDGFGVYRTVAFDEPTSKWLKPILEVINDKRIISTGTSSGSLRVTFSGSNRADSTENFPISDVDKVLNPPAKKAAAKKSTAKKAAKKAPAKKD